MNVLAHLVLAGEDPALQAGGFLGDFVKGPVSEAWSEGLAAGIRLHRYIDARSNESEAIRASAASLAGIPRRYAPPFVDLLADYFLANNFESLQGESLESYSRRALANLLQFRESFPLDAQRFLDRIIEIDLLVSYRNASTMTRVAGRLLERLRLPPELAESFRTALDQPAHRAEFERYYPHLQALTLDWHAARADQDRA